MPPFMKAFEILRNTAEKNFFFLKFLNSFHYAMDLINRIIFI